MYLLCTRRLTLFVCRNLPRSNRHRRSWGTYTFTASGKTGRFVWAGPLHFQVVTGRYVSRA